MSFNLADTIETCPKTTATSQKCVFYLDHEEKFLYNKQNNYKRMWLLLCDCIPLEKF